MKLKNILAAGLLLTSIGTDTYARERTVQVGEPVRIEQTVAADSIESNATTMRRRAVRRPASPSHIMHGVLADDDLRYTNHAAVPNTIRACIERTATCITDTLAPGASITKTDVVRTLGLDTASLELYTTGNAEIRGHNDAIPTTLITPERQNIPIMGENQTFQVYTWSPGTAELAYLLSNGVERDRETIQLSPGTTTLTPRPLQTGEQLDLIPNGPAIMTSTVNGVQYRAKALSEATGVHYVLRADAATTSWAKNPDPTGILTFATLGLPQDRDNTQSNYVKDYTAINWGTTFMKESVQVPGSMAIRGMWVTDKNMPFNAWSNGTTQTQGATAENSFGPTGAQRYNASINQLPPDHTITILAADDIPASYTITGHNDNGNQTGTIEGTLPIHGNTTITAPAGSTRVTLSAKNATNNYTRQPHILIGATIDGINKAGYRVEKPFAGTTGKEYVDTWLKPLEGRIFYLNNREFKCMINGNCGVRSYAPDLAAALYPTSNYPGTVQDFEQFFRKLTDGNNANGEAFYTKDPLKVSTQSIGKYHLVSLHPNDGAIKTDMNDATAAAVFNVYGSFLEEFTQKQPGEYGGTTATGPNKTLSPTWDSRNNNDPNTGLGM